MKNKVILYIAMSIDGYIATENGSVQWLDAFTTPQEDYGYNVFYQSISTVVMGSTTFKQTLSFGEYPYKEKHSYIFSHQKITDLNVHFVRGDVTSVLNAFDPKKHPRIWIVGGAQLIAQCIDENVIDEYRLFIMPVFLGNGIKLFKGNLRSLQLKLFKQKTFKSGVVELHYKRK